MPQESTEFCYDELKRRAIYPIGHQEPNPLDLTMYKVWIGRSIELGYEPEEQDIKNQQRLASQIGAIKDFQKSLESSIYLDLEAEISKAKEFLEHFEKYPPSHNRNLALGALEYITVALRKIIAITLPKQVEFHDYISDYLNAISSIVSLSPEEFMDKNIIDLESLFKRIESFCSENNLLPGIDENNINLENFI